MKKFGKVIVVIFKVIVLLWVLFLLVYLGTAIFNRNVENKFVTEKGNYGKNPTWLADSDTTEADDIYAAMSTNGNAETAYLMYELACKKMMLAKSFGVRAVSDIHAEALGYKIDVASNRTEQYYVPATPVLNANQKVLSSYTNTIYVINVSDDFLAAILKAAIMFADRGYADGENSYKQKGSLELMEGDEEKIEWSTSYEEVDTSGDRTYEDDEIRDKCNFIVSRETILSEGASITREYDEEQDAYLYHVVFDLNCSGEGRENSAYFEEKALKDTLDSNLQEIHYTALHIEFDMYSNGYMTAWNSAQEWNIRYKVAFFDLRGEAQIVKNEVMSYDPEECEVVDFTK